MTEVVPLHSPSTTLASLVHLLGLAGEHDHVEIDISIRPINVFLLYDPRGIFEQGGA